MAEPNERQIEVIAETELSDHNYNWDLPGVDYILGELPETETCKIEISELNGTGDFKIGVTMNGEVRRADFTKDRITQYWDGPENPVDGTGPRPVITTPIAIKILAKEVRDLREQQARVSNNNASDLSWTMNTVDARLESISDAVNKLVAKVGAESRANATFRKRWEPVLQKLLRPKSKMKKLRNAMVMKSKPGLPKHNP